MAVGWNTPPGGEKMSVAGWIAMMLGIIATLALGVGLMTLMFYSNRTAGTKAWPSMLPMEARTEAELPRGRAGSTSRSGTASAASRSATATRSSC